MLSTVFDKSILKQGLYVQITFWIYASFGASRSYSSLLFYQLDLPDSELHLNNDEKTWLVVLMGILSPITCIPCGFLMDAIGRKKCVQFMFIPYLTAWIITSLSTNYTMLLIAVIIEGVGLGMSVCLITYVVEISSMNVRRQLVALMSISTNFGMILCNFLMYFFKWKTVSTVFGFLTAFYMILTYLLPESPLWFYLKGRKEKAIDVLCSIKCKNVDQIENEIKDLEKMYLTRSKKTGYKQIFKNCVNGWKQFTIATVFCTLLYFCGPFMIIAYGVIIMDHLRMPYDSALVTVIHTFSSFIGSLFTTYVALKCKRRVNLLISAGGMSLCMLVIGVYEELFYFKDEKPYALILPVAMCSYSFLSSLGVMSIGFIIGGELFPLEARGALQGLYGFFVFIMVMVCSRYYPFILFNFGIKALIWSNVTFCLLSVLFTIFILPETAGKTLVEIQEQYFSKKKTNTITS